MKDQWRAAETIRTEQDKMIYNLRIQLAFSHKENAKLTKKLEKTQIQKITSK